MIPALAGPALAGWVTETHDWRYVFAGLATLAAATTLLVLPRLARVAAAQAQPAAADDPRPAALPRAAVTDAVLIALGAGIALAGLERGGAGGVVVLLAGVVLVRRPLARSLPPGYWTGRTPLAAALLTRMLACAAFFGIEAWLPWTLNRGGLASPLIAGLILSAAACGWTAATWWVDGAIARLGALRILAGAGLVLVAGTGLAWYGASLRGSVGLIALAWSLAGLAMGMVYPVVSSLAMARAERGREGRLSMMLGLSDTLGITAAIGLGGAWLRAEQPGALARVDGLWLGFVLVAVLVPALVAWRRRALTGAAASPAQVA
jgi:hypothetical protein